MARSGNNTTTDRGREAEALAARYLERQGIRIIERNFRVKGGEIDLIGKDREQGTLVFVEVRLRSNQDFGGAGASITRQKQARLLLAARHYLSRNPDADCRFDCILLDRLDENGLEWIPNAFSAES